MFRFYNSGEENTMTFALDKPQAFMVKYNNKDIKAYAASAETGTDNCSDVRQ